MHNFILAPALAIAALAQSPALAQEAQADPAPVASPAAAPTTEQRIAELEQALARQTAIADNARQSLEQLRTEAALKDELLVLGRTRNAELYAIAMEIAEKHVRKRDWEVFLQHDRVRMENLKQSYEDRLRAARIYETTLPPSVQQRMDAELDSGSAAPVSEPQN